MVALVKACAPASQRSRVRLQECGYVPGLVLWFRYSGFLVLYPAGAWRRCSELRAYANPPRSPAPGVAGELSVVYMALPYLRQRKLYSVDMPNALNFAFSVTALFRLVSLAYVFGLPMVRNSPAAPARAGAR